MALFTSPPPPPNTQSVTNVTVKDKEGKELTVITKTNETWQAWFSLLWPKFQQISILPTPFTLGDLFYASSTTAVSSLPDVAAGSYLRSGGVGVAPLWSTLILPNAATTGDIPIATSSNTLTMLADVAAGSFLRSAGVGTAPAWSTTVWPNAATQGDLLFASAANTFTVLAKNTTATRYLSNTGTTNNPAWAQIALTTGVTGVLPEANGGTNQSTYTTGDILYASAANTLSKLADVAAGSYLRSGGVGTAPLWSTLTLPNAATTGDLLIASATNTISRLADVATGNALLSGGVGVAPAWGKLAASDLSNGTTGSGLIVLATSPTITTAVLGSSTATTQSPNDNSTKLATTAYVDNAALGQNYKEACKYGTTTALPSVVYANGSSGVGATLTAAAFGAVSFDGSTPSVGDRVLVKNQVSTFQNGIYTVTVVGAVAALFVLTRATDFNQSFEIKTGDSTFITAGTSLTATTWAVSSVDNPVMGTDAITFAQTAGQGSFLAGNGITITGTTISVSQMQLSDIMAFAAAN